MHAAFRASSRETVARYEYRDVECDWLSLTSNIQRSTSRLNASHNKVTSYDIRIHL